MPSPDDNWSAPSDVDHERKRKAAKRKRQQAERQRNYNVWGLSPAEIRQVQREVGATVDGVYGPRTAAAVRAYQSKHGLSADGIVGPKTAAAIGFSIGGGGGGGANDGGGGGGNDDGGGKKPKRDKSAEIAAQFGYTLAFFKADPELKRLLHRATTQGYNAARFTAEFQNTDWFRHHSEAFRKWTALQKGDPATLKQLTGSATAKLKAMAQQMGATQFDDGELRQMAIEGIKFGWTDDQQKAALLSHVQVNKQGRWQGDAGTYKEKFDSILGAYGVKVGQDHMGQWVRGALKGTMNEAYVTQYAQQAAMSRYPGIADRLKAGETLAQIVDPYKQSYSQILEVNPETIKLHDPLLQRALGAKDKKGKPTTQTIWQFEQHLRNDPRWLKTDNAQDSAMQTAHQVLTDLGLKGA